jgi:predicted amidophosphoribosyltransferase
VCTYRIDEGIGRLYLVALPESVLRLEYSSCGQATKSLKKVLDPRERANELAGAFAFDREQQNRRVLLVDDLYRSGATATDTFLKVSKARGARDLLHAVLPRRRQ